MSSLDDKVDNLKDDVNDVKIDIAEVKSDVKHISEKFDNTMSIFREHVEGDNKIVSHLDPILPLLASMAKDHDFKKQKKKKRKEFLETWGLHLKFFITVSAVCSIFYGYVSRFH